MGGDGVQTIHSGAGNDLLIGGKGNDTFVFSGEFGDDTILGFNVGNNMIDLSAFEYADIRFEELDYEVGEETVASLKITINDSNDDDSLLGTITFVGVTDEAAITSAIFG